MAKLNKAQKEDLKLLKKIWAEAKELQASNRPIKSSDYTFLFAMEKGEEFFHELERLYISGDDREGQVDVLRERLKQEIEKEGLEVFKINKEITLALNESGIVGVFEHVALSSFRTVILTTGFKEGYGEKLKAEIRALKEESCARPVTRLTYFGNGNIKEHRETVTSKDKEGYPNEFYPFFDKTPEEIWDGFEKSDSNVLVLIGPPGTGKTSFIRAMMDRQGWKEVTIADDENVLMDRVMGNVMRSVGQGGVFIAEDADNFARKREEGNENMSALLNTAEGLVKTDTKFIISTNLVNLKHVDEALIRPGRAYRVLEFKVLSLEEAKKVRKVMGKSVEHMDPSKDEWTLSEAINLDDIGEDSRRTNVFGFI